jgi:hypothetical protein
VVARAALEREQRVGRRWGRGSLAGALATPIVPVERVLAHGSTLRVRAARVQPGTLARMPRQVALLRGINLARNRRLGMGPLRELLGSLGYGDVQTLGQSGNVVLTSDATPDRLAGELERAIADGLGIDPKVVVRTRDELADVVARDPLGDVATEPRRYQVSFLSAATSRRSGS